MTETAAEYLVSSAVAVLGGGPGTVAHIQDTRQTAGPGGVSQNGVFWERSVTDSHDQLDGPGEPVTEFFTIECRSEFKQAYAAKLAADLEHELVAGGRVTHIVARYDEPQNAFYKPGRYTTSFLEVGLMAGP